MTLNVQMVVLLRTLERALIGVVVILILYAACALWNEFRRPFEFTVPAVASVENALGTGVHPFSAYAEQFARRSLFEFAPAGAQTEYDAALGAGQPLPPHLKVVGVIITNPPEVIIEDQQAGQTYFLRLEEPNGPFRVRSVSKEQLTLDYQGQSFEVDLRR